MDANRVNLIERIVRENAPLLVGELLSNLECLNLSDGQKLSFNQIKTIFKQLLREKIYQNTRNLNKLIRAILVEDRILFRKKPRENNSG